MIINVIPNKTTVHVVDAANDVNFTVNSTNLRAGLTLKSPTEVPLALMRGIHGAYDAKQLIINPLNADLIITITGEGTASLLFNDAEIPVPPGTYNMNALEHIQISMNGVTSTLYADALPE